MDRIIDLCSPEAVGHLEVAGRLDDLLDPEGQS